MREQKAKVLKVLHTNFLLFSANCLLQPSCTLIDHALWPYSDIHLQPNLKVLLDGLHDPNSILNMLRMPIVKSPLMKMIWDLVTEDWQVFSNNHHHHHWWHIWHHILISAVRSSTKEALLERLPDGASNLRLRGLLEETFLQFWSLFYPSFYLLVTSLLLGNRWVQTLRHAMVVITRWSSRWLNLAHNNMSHMISLFHDFCTMHSTHLIKKSSPPLAPCCSLCSSSPSQLDKPACLIIRLVIGFCIWSSVCQVRW